MDKNQQITKARKNEQTNFNISFGNNYSLLQQD